MARGRARTIALAGFGGVILGIAVTLASQSREPALQSGGGRRVIRAGPNTGLPFSNGILVGNTLYLAGAIGGAATGVVPGGIEAETRQALANLGEVLKAGHDFSGCVNGDRVHRELR